MPDVGREGILGDHRLELKELPHIIHRYVTHTIESCHLSLIYPVLYRCRMRDVIKKRGSAVAAFFCSDLGEDLGDVGALLRGRPQVFPQFPLIFPAA